MNKKGNAMIVILIIVVIIVFVGFSIFAGKDLSYNRYAKYKTNSTHNQTNSTNQTYERNLSNPVRLSIASWNLDVFGRTKASSNHLMEDYVSAIENYDVVITQEIRDQTGDAFKQLCDRLPEYYCYTSSRAGTTSVMEQYGIIVNKNFRLDNLFDFNPDQKNRWERPPIKFTIDTGRYKVTIYTIHIDPDEATNEIQSLQYAIGDEENVVILGDLNADCDYYNRQQEPTFINYNWLITDEDDTTTSASTSCAYDRILVNGGAQKLVESYGIMDEVTPEESDHYLVYVILEG